MFSAYTDYPPQKRRLCFLKRNTRIKRPKSSSVMKLNPQQAPLYGECLLTVQLCDEERFEDEEDVEFYLLFSGTTQRHLTSTLRVSHVTLQAICPAHDCCESVRVTLCSSRPGRPVDTVSEECFQFVQDLAFDMAQFLVSTAGQDDGLEGAMMLDECQIPLQECERLDESLSLALRHLALPPGWSVLGTNLGSDTAPAPQETLLHFAARRGLRRVAVFLLQQPGGREALRVPNKQGAVPASIAEKRGHSHLQQLLTPEDTSLWATTEAPLKNSEGRVIRHHPGLNTYTLTVATPPGTPPPNLQEDVEELQHLIRSRSEKGASSSQPQSELEEHGQECGEGLGTVTEQACLDERQQDSLCATERRSEGDSVQHVDQPSQVCDHWSGAGVDPGPDALEPPQESPSEPSSGDGNIGESKHPSQNCDRDFQAEQEERIELSCSLAPEGDCGKVLDKSHSAQSGKSPSLSVPSCGNRQQETDIVPKAISPEQGVDKESQEEEKGEERVEKTTEQTSDREAAGMGQAQSQERPEMAGSDVEGHEHSQEVEQDGEKVSEALSEAERKADSENKQPLSGTLLVQNLQEDGEESQDVDAGPEFVWDSVPHPNPQEMDPQFIPSEAEMNPETLALDCSAENKQDDCNCESNETPQHEQDACRESHSSLVAETGSLCGGINGSAESELITRAEPSQSECNAEEYPSPAQQEGSPVDGESLESDAAPPAEGQTSCNLEGPLEPREQEEPTCCGEESSVDTSQQDSQSPAFQSVSEPPESPAQNDLISTSCPQETVLVIEEGAGADDLSSEDLVPTSVQDSHLPITDSVAEPVPQPGVSEVCEDVPPAQEVHSLSQENVGVPLQMDESITHMDTASHSEGASQAQLEEEGGETEITSSDESDRPSSANEDVTVVSQQECPPDLPREELADDGHLLLLEGQGEKTPESKPSESKLESKETTSLSNGAEMEPATPSSPQEAVIHVEDVSLPVMHTEQKEMAMERLHEEEGPGQDMQEDRPEAAEPEETAEATSINGGDLGQDGSAVMLEQSVADTPEQTAVAPSLEAKIEEEIESQDGELTSGEVVSPFLGLDSGADDGISTSEKGQEAMHEEPALPSPATPVNCDLVIPDMAGVIPPKDPIYSFPLGLERVEEESEETGESKSPCEEVPTDPNKETEALPACDHVDGRRESASGEAKDSGDEINREKDTFYSIDSCGGPGPLEKKPILECPESPLSPPPGRSASTTKRDSGSDADGFFSPDAGEDGVFRKAEETVTVDSTSEVSVSCSSTDDTTSLGPPSSTPDSYVGAALGRRWSSEDGRQPGEAEEEKDRLTEVPICPALLRTSGRSLSPVRRHSWGPGKISAGEAEMNQRSSLKSLGEGKPTFHRRSYSLEGLILDRQGGKESPPQGTVPRDPRRIPRQESEERGSLVSLTEEEQESDLGDCSSLDSQISGGLRPARHSSQSMTLPLTKSVSMLTISQKELDAMGRPRPKRRISFSFSISPILPKSKTVFSIGSSSSDEEEACSMRSFSNATLSLGESISEEDPGPLRSDFEGKGVTRVSRTFSYLKSKMYKKSKEKDKDKSKDKEKEAKEKKTVNGHHFSPAISSLPIQCYQCNKAVNTKDAFHCTNCNAYVHKGCKEILPACAKVKMKQQKQQTVVTDSAAMPVVTLRNKSTPSRERPWSAISVPDDPALVTAPRRHTSMMTFNSSNLSKSMSISNIAGPVFDEMPLKGLRYLSQSTDSLHKTSKVNESTESLTDEGTEMMDSQLMGEFEADAKELEADSWSFTQDRKYLKQHKKDIIKRQDVIYELMQTEMHHVRTLKIMADVYSKGLLKELQVETKTVEQMFPVLDDLLELHSSFFSRMLERKRESQQEGKDGGYVIRKIGDLLVTQFSDSNAERMKKVYGKFCSRHNEAVNFYKDLHTKDKRFQGFIKRKMSSTIVRRLGIPECILLVTQRITKYPVLLQRILQHTKENEEDYWNITESLRLVKEVLAAVDSKVNEHEKKRRLKEVYSRTDSKSIMRMKSGQMFAREDLIRGRKLLHDGPLLLKNAAGRLKEVQALLLSDIFVFLQEKDQKFVFASLDQRSTVISLQKLIVREVANEEKGLFLITAGMAMPEMVEVHASSKEERNTWMQLIQEAMQSIEKDEDEGIPSETEEDKRQLETKAREMRELLRKKDEQIVALLEEKVKLFREMCDCGTAEDASPVSRTLFRASADDMPKGEPVMKDALKEVETLQTLVNGSLGGAIGQLESASGGVGPVCLPRRAETFGGFDSHQMNISKNGEKDEGEDSADLRRTESDSVLKKGGNANLLLLLKRNSEQVLHSVTHLHDLLNTLQAVVVQQDSFIEDQRQALSERPPSRPSSRPSSLIEQEKQRSLEKQRQEAANLQRQQAAHAEERRRREREWSAREQALGEREALLVVQEEEAQRGRRELESERQELLARKEEYQRDLERLRDAQRKLERDKEQVRRELERVEQNRLAEEKQMLRTPSTTSEDSLLFQSSSSLDRDMGECELSSSPKKDCMSRLDSKRKGKNFIPFASNASLKSSSGEGQNQIPNRLMQLGKTKDKKEKKKKKGKGQQPTESPHVPVSDQPLDGEIFFC
ncbi:hypothetical protein GJAV_G00247190 [Gymnothorax javanicus]|nr:hypothetical protein GJAV_G00247190 [Gymnothorax javanicus]